MKKTELTNNQLKIIAMIAMTVDHIGLILFPGVLLFRAVGRLAFPIYAYMIAEGCRHTKHIGRYFLSVAAMGAVCQVAYYVFLHSLYMCILVTFSLSIGLIALIRYAGKQRSVLSCLLAALGMIGALILTRPHLIPGTDYAVDYGFIGAALPVCIYLAEEKSEKLLATALGLFCLSLVPDVSYLQLLSLLAVPLLALYNGRRGKARLKWFFYFFYPLHLLAIYAVSLFL